MVFGEISGLVWCVFGGGLVFRPCSRIRRSTLYVSCFVECFCMAWALFIGIGLMFWGFGDGEFLFFQALVLFLLSGTFLCGGLVFCGIF